MTYNPSISNGLPHPDDDGEFYYGVAFRRLLAWIIDTIIIIALSVIATLVLGVLTLGIAVLFTSVLFMVTGFVYRVAFIASKSATLGMAVMGIEFRTIRGHKFELREALIHTGIYTVMVMTFFGQVASILTMLTTRYGRSIPDFVLGSTVINRPLQ